MDVGEIIRHVRAMSDRVAYDGLPRDLVTEIVRQVRGTAYDSLPREFDREIRSKLLDFEPHAATRRPTQWGFRNEDLPARNAEIKTFKYTKLPSNKRRIRLLRLLPGVLDNPQVDCELFEAEFDDKTYDLVRVQSPEASTVSPQDGSIKVHDQSSNGSAKAKAESSHLTNGEPGTKTQSDQQKDQNVSKEQQTRKKDIIQYEALSWKWGDERHGEHAIMIHKDGVLYRKRVSQTLGLALKYLRYGKDRYIWVDAICINQDDDDERSSQVSMMSLVYSGAKQVCVWLGEDDDESRMAFRFIREEIKGLKNFDLLCTDKQHAPKWRALLVLMQRAWFSRRWVVQEVVLARDATVYCGPDDIPWRELAIAVELFVEVETATHRLSELMKKDEKFSLIPNWFEHISELGASILVNATAKVFRESKRADSATVKEALSQRSLLSLEYLVTSLSIFECGRPHDFVYALVAVARDARPLAPSAFGERTREALVVEVCSHFLEQKPYVLNYSSPYADVCKAFIQFCILRCAETDKIQALNILCRPWAKDWRPGEDKSLHPEDESYDSQTDQISQAISRNSKERSGQSKNDHEKRPFIKHEGPWDIRLTFQQLKEKIHGSGNQYIDKLLKREEIEFITKSSSDEEQKVIRDMREMLEYWDDAQSSYKREDALIRGNKENAMKRNEKRPINPIIMKWFPAKNEHELSKENPTRTQAAKAESTIPRSKRSTKPKKTQQNGLDIHNPRIHELGLPSWVGRITMAPFDIFPHPGMDMVKMGRKNADPLVGVPEDGHRNYSAGQTKKIDLETLKFRKRPRHNHFSLYVEGFWFDTVQEVAQVSQGGAIPGTWLDLAGWDKARRPLRSGVDVKDPIDVGDPPDEFWRTLVADRGKNDRNPPYYYARACRETIIKGGLRSGAVDTTALIYNERNSIVAEFCRRVQAVIWNRALIKTEKGALGLASDKVKAGDKICIIYGCTVPIILRKGDWKTKEEHDLEKFEDGVEAMESLMRKCENNRARKARWEQAKKTMERDKLRYIQQETEAHNVKMKLEGEKMKKRRERHTDPEPAESDMESEDDTDIDTEDDGAEVATEHRDPTLVQGKEATAEVTSRHQQEQGTLEEKPARDVTWYSEAGAEMEDEARTQKQTQQAGTVPIPAEIATQSSAPTEWVKGGENADAQKQPRQMEDHPDEKGARKLHRHEQKRAIDQPDGIQEPVHEPQSRSEIKQDIGKSEAGYSNQESGPTSKEEQQTAQPNGAIATTERPPQKLSTAAKKLIKQQKADGRDPYRHYEFLGEAYVHGMMDGQAVRQNSYKLKPDHIFEIR